MNDKIEQEFLLNFSKTLDEIDKFDNRLGGIHTKLKEVAKTDPFRDAARSGAKESANMEKQLLKSVDTYAKVTNSAKAYEAEIKKLVKEKERLNKSQKEFIAAGNYDKYQKELKRVNDRIKEVNTSLGKTPGFASKFGSVVSNLSGGLLSSTTALLGGLSVSLFALGKKAFEAQAGFQGFQAQLSVGLGSQELANQNLSVLEGLAAKLPGSLDTLTDSYARLVNRGFKPTKEELFNLSGLAASQNKEFSQLTEAILDAEGGELERLKEFGIQAKNVGDKVQISFNGVTKEFTKNAREATKAFSELSVEAGLPALNDAKMKTLDGRLSNVGDQMDRLFRLLGKFLLPAFETLFNIIEGGLTFLDDVATGFGLLNTKMTDNKQNITEQVYPAFERLFSLFDLSGPNSKKIQIFTLGITAGWEKVKNMVSLAISEVEYFLKIIGNVGKLGTGFGFDDLRKANKEAEDQRERDRIQYNKNRRDIGRGTGRALAEIINPSGPGELGYGAGTGTGAGGPTEAEIAAAKKRAEEAAAARKKRAEEEKRTLERLEKELKDKLLELEKQYGKDRLEALRGDGLAYLAEKKRLDLEEIDQEEKTLLKLKQLTAGAKKGKFDKQGNPIADTSVQLTDAERAPFNFRRERVSDDEYRQRAELEMAAQRELTKELSNEYQRQLQDVEEKYERLFKLAEKNEKALQQLRVRKAQETEDILLNQELDRLENTYKQEALAKEVELYDAQAQNRIDIETKVTKELLEIEKKFLQAKLAAIVASGIDVNDSRVTALLAQIAQMDAQLSKIQKVAAKSDDVRSKLKRLFFKKRGVSDAELDDPNYSNPELDEDFEKIIGYVGEFTNVLEDLYQVQLQISQRKIDLINQEIDAKKEQIDQEKALNEEGLANNLDLRNKELAELKKQRERALLEQQRLQRIQLISDTILQGSNLVTASSGLFKALAPIPVIGLPLAIAAIATMFGAFASSKIKAFQLSKQVPVFEKGGPHWGKRHSQGGELVEVEDGEYTTNRKSTAKYYDLIEAINEDDSSRVRREALKQLLRGSGVSMMENHRRTETAFMQHYGQEMAGRDGRDLAAIRETLERMEGHLGGIGSDTKRIPSKQLVALGEGRYLEETENSKVVRDVSSMLG